MKKSKIMLAVCCIIALIATVSVSFAVWDNLGAQDDTIQAAFGKNVRVKLSNSQTFNNASFNLVPKDAICGTTDTQMYTDAKFTVELLDLDSKSTLDYTLRVISDGGLNISQYFDITISTVVTDASVSYSYNAELAAPKVKEDKPLIGKGGFVGQITVPKSTTSETDSNEVVPGSAEFSINMAFKDGASTMTGIEQIIGRKFNLKIDILAEKG